MLDAPDIDDPALAAPDPAERSAICHGIKTKADLVLIDDRKGSAAAASKGFETIGTLGIPFQDRWPNSRDTVMGTFALPQLAKL